MTRVLLTNSNTSVTTPRCIEIWTTKRDNNFDHNVISYNYPYPPSDWLSGGVVVDPQTIFFDLKQTTQSFMITGKVDVDSNRNIDSTFSANPVAYIDYIEDYLLDIANSGGVVKLIVISGVGSREYYGCIMNMRIGEVQQEQGPGVTTGTSTSPEQYEIQFTIQIGENAEV
jgi:hypothetical protein